MKVFSLIAFALVGGYAFSTIWTPSLYHAARESGHRLYLRVVFYAAFLLVISFCLHILLFLNFGGYPETLKFINRFIGLPQDDISIFSKSSKVSILFLSFVLGPTLGHLFNFPRLFSSFKPFFLFEKKVLEHAIKNNDFEKIIARSVYTQLPILFTLDSGKIYLGWAVSLPNPVQERRSVRILPIASGHRDKNTQIVNFTTDYLPVLKAATTENNNICLEDFEIVLPVSQISSCHLFNFDVYINFFQRKSSDFQKINLC